MQKPEHNDYNHTEINRIAVWNEYCGNERKHRELSDPSVIGSCNLIQEEYYEMLNALIDEDRKEVVDASADIIVVVTGLLHNLGYNPVKVMDIVNTSNFSKFVDPNNQADVQKTLDQYKNDLRYKDVYVNKDGVVWGTVIATGSQKVLKGCNYFPPRWEQLDPELK